MGVVGKLRVGERSIGGIRLVEGTFVLCLGYIEYEARVGIGKQTCGRTATISLPYTCISRVYWHIAYYTNYLILTSFACATLKVLLSNIDKCFVYSQLILEEREGRISFPSQ
jgi:hypothetical protein